jgi:hypothetical protein
MRDRRVLDLLTGLGELGEDVFAAASVGSMFCGESSLKSL